MAQRALFRFGFAGRSCSYVGTNLHLAKGREKALYLCIVCAGVLPCARGRAGIRTREDESGHPPTVTVRPRHQLLGDNADLISFGFEAPVLDDNRSRGSVAKRLSLPPDKLIADEHKITCDSVDQVDSSRSIYVWRPRGRGLSSPGALVGVPILRSPSGTVLVSRASAGGAGAVGRARRGGWRWWARIVVFCVCYFCDFFLCYVCEFRVCYVEFGELSNTLSSGCFWGK